MLRYKNTGKAIILSSGQWASERKEKGTAFGKGNERQGQCAEFLVQHTDVGFMRNE